MAYVKKKYDDYELIAYRSLPGGPELLWKSPSRKATREFIEWADGYRKIKQPIPDPSEFFGEHVSASGDAAQRRARAAAGMTLGQWIFGGDGNDDKGTGPFLEARKPSPTRSDTYRRAVRLKAASIRHTPMHAVTLDDAQRILDYMAACPACESRAVDAGAIEVLADPANLSAANVPWDYDQHRVAGVEEEDIPCSVVADDPTHFSRHQLETITGLRNALSVVWKAALAAKDLGTSGLEDLMVNPFRLARVPANVDRPDNNDDMTALSHEQLNTWTAAMPEWCVPAVFIGAYAMNRRAELLGHTRRSLRKVDNRYILRVRIVNKRRNKGAQYSNRGKNPGATTGEIMLPADLTEMIDTHLERWCSVPSDDCAACRGEVPPINVKGRNAHRKCDFADNTFLWRDPQFRRVPHPDTFSKILEEAAVAAGLTEATVGFRVTSKVLRCTGATLMLDAGIEMAVVAELGRWKTVKVLEQTYNRASQSIRRKAAQKLESHRRTELGIVDDAATTETKLEALHTRVEHLSSKLETAQRMLDEHGLGDPTSIERIRVFEPRATKFTDEAVTAAIAAGGTRKAMLERIGVAPARKNYQRLAKMADELRLPLPASYEKGTGLTG